MVTQITALTTLTPTRKLNGKPLTLVVEFSPRATRLRLDSCRARENYHVDRQLL
jgi:hypothetical protein